MANGADTNRTDRGRSRSATGEPTFSEQQRVWLLERDLDEQDHQARLFREEVRKDFEEMKSIVSRRLNWLTGVGFSLLVSVLGVLVAVIASRA